VGEGALYWVQAAATSRHYYDTNATTHSRWRRICFAGPPLRCRWFSRLLSSSSSVLQGETETVFFIIGSPSNH
jgi:hypothetical protein